MPVARFVRFALALTGGMVLAACGPAPGTAAPDAPTLAGRSLHHWSSLLEPAPEDRAWLDIPWHASFHDGLQAADEAERPLMLWLMNGHPLGCT